MLPGLLGNLSIDFHLASIGLFQLSSPLDVFHVLLDVKLCHLRNLCRIIEKLATFYGILFLGHFETSKTFLLHVVICLKHVEGLIIIQGWNTSWSSDFLVRGALESTFLLCYSIRTHRSCGNA